jgi:hypothetical protein
MDEFAPAGMPHTGGVSFADRLSDVENRFAAREPSIHAFIPEAGRFDRLRREARGRRGRLLRRGRRAPRDTSTMTLPSMTVGSMRETFPRTVPWWVSTSATRPMVTSRAWASGTFSWALSFLGLVILATIVLPLIASGEITGQAGIERGECEIGTPAAEPQFLDRRHDPAKPGLDTDHAAPARVAGRIREKPVSLARAARHRRARGLDIPETRGAGSRQRQPAYPVPPFAKNGVRQAHHEQQHFHARPLRPGLARRRNAEVAPTAQRLTADEIRVCAGLNRYPRRRRGRSFLEPFGDVGAADSRA